MRRDATRRDERCNSAAVQRRHVDEDQGNIRRPHGQWRTGVSTAHGTGILDADQLHDTAHRLPCNLGCAIAAAKPEEARTWTG